MSEVARTRCNFIKAHAEGMLAGQRGATAIEYALIAAGISVVITAVNTLGGQVKTTFTNVKSSLANAGK